MLTNWAGILYENNKGINKLSEVPLTDGEMQQPPFKRGSVLQHDRRWDLLPLLINGMPMNLGRSNASFAKILAVFEAAGIEDFKKLPEDPTEKAAFAKHFKEFNDVLAAAKIQGFTWEKADTAEGNYPETEVAFAMLRHQYDTLVQRYKELGGGGGAPFPPYHRSSRRSQRFTCGKCISIHHGRSAITRATFKHGRRTSRWRRLSSA